MLQLCRILAKAKREAVHSEDHALRILKCIAMFRLTNPEAEIKVCAGRSHLRSLQSMVLCAGATGIMIGPLLTTSGGDVEHDLQMLRDLGMLPDDYPQPSTP